MLLKDLNQVRCTHVAQQNPNQFFWSPFSKMQIFKILILCQYCLLVGVRILSNINVIFEPSNMLFTCVALRPLFFRKLTNR